MPRSIVVEYDPRQVMRRRLLVLGGLLVAAVLGGVTGYKFADPGAETAASSSIGQNDESTVSTGGISREQRVINAETASEIDRKALESLRSEMAEYRRETAELEQAVGFYRNLMAPNDVDKAVSFGAVEFTNGAAPGRYKYRIVVQQTAKKHTEQRGYLLVSFDALRDEESVKVPLRELHVDAEGGEIPLQFKYFQSIEGEIIIPENLILTGVRLSVSIKRPKQLMLEHQVPWQFGH